MDVHTLLLAGLRGLHLTATLSLLGAALFAAWLAPSGERPALLRLARVSGGFAIGFGAAWFVLQAAVIADAGSAGEMLAALPAVGMHTRFGQLLAVRLLLLAAALTVIGWRRMGPGLALAFAGVAVAMQGAIGHVGAVGGDTGAGLIVSEALHLLAAGVWLGGLLPLLICLRRLPAQAAADLCQAFSPVGLGCVLLIAFTGLAQGLELVGTVPALVGTAYGRIAMLKIVLFLVALGFAAYNRLTLTDQLVEGDATAARRQLGRSIGAETVIGLVIVLAAGVLASTTPGAHQQPDWPLPWRFSLVALGEPELRLEVAISAVVVAAGLAVVAASLFWRRGRVVAVLLALGLVVWRGPSFGLLLVDAVPTSFYRSPTGFSAAAVVHGQALYGANCAVCHGASGRGDGPAASGRMHPADLTASHLWEHSDGELFWWISDGMRDGEGALAMPGFAATLSEADRWDLIDFIHANNAGIALRMAGTRSAAPAIPIRCTGNRFSQLSDLRGRVVLVIAEAPSHVTGPPTIAPQDGFPVVALYLGGSRPGKGCVAEAPDARAAFAVAAGLASGVPPGTEFIVDPEGWLRAMVRKEDAWSNPALLEATIRTVCDHLAGATPDAGGQHHH